MLFLLDRVREGEMIGLYTVKFLFFKLYIYDILHVQICLPKIMGIHLNTLELHWARPCVRLSLSWMNHSRHGRREEKRRRRSRNTPPSRASRCCPSRRSSSASRTVQPGTHRRCTRVRRRKFVGDAAMVVCFSTYTYSVHKERRRSGDADLKLTHCTLTGGSQRSKGRGPEERPDRGWVCHLCLPKTVVHGSWRPWAVAPGPRC